MNDTVSIRLPRTIVERLEEEARNAGLTLEEYILEPILYDLILVKELESTLRLLKTS